MTEMGTTTIQRKVQSPEGRVFNVRITRAGIEAKEVGRGAYFGPLSWGSIHDLAAKQEAERKRRDGQTAKLQKKVTRGLLTT